MYRRVIASPAIVAVDPDDICGVEATGSTKATYRALERRSQVGRIATRQLAPSSVGEQRTPTGSPAFDLSIELRKEAIRQRHHDLGREAEDSVKYCRWDSSGLAWMDRQTPQRVGAA